MTIYAIYFMYFLALIFWARGRKFEFIVDAQDTQYILIGLVLYSLSNLLSRILILLEWKNDSFEIVNSHFLLFGIGFFFYDKLKKVDG